MTPRTTSTFEKWEADHARYSFGPGTSPNAGLVASKWDNLIDLRVKSPNGNPPVPVPRSSSSSSSSKSSSSSS